MGFIFTLSHFISQIPTTRFLSITGHWDVSLPSGASLWNGIFARVEGQNITLCPGFMQDREPFEICSPIIREIRIQSQIEAYQRLKKWYLIPPCLTLSIIRYGSRVKWSNPRKEIAPFPRSWCCSFRKGNLRVTLNYGRPLLIRRFIDIHLYKFISLAHQLVLWVRLK